MFEYLNGSRVFLQRGQHFLPEIIPLQFSNTSENDYRFYVSVRGPGLQVAIRFDKMTKSIFNNGTAQRDISNW